MRRRPPRSPRTDPPFPYPARFRSAKGATSDVTLGPGAHTGSTGPCADALIAAGVTRVVAAMRDPFEAVDGQGFERLRAAGVQVQSGLSVDQARVLNRGVLSRVGRARPSHSIQQGDPHPGPPAQSHSQWTQHTLKP